MKTKYQLSKVRVQRLRLQGFTQQSESELSELAFGIRFAYRVCTALVILGLAIQSVPILAGIMAIAFFSAILPNHPFDYIYNHVLSKRMGRPQLPPRSKQLTFACSIATVWLGTVIAFFLAGHAITATLLGVAFTSVAILLSTTDICIPSIIYKFIFKS